MAAAVALAVQYRFILRHRDGGVLMRPVPGSPAEFSAHGEPLAFPSYMAALRGRALRGMPHEIAIIQQENHDV